MGTAHAQHNEKVCDHLSTLNDYHDWVVTTAFYTALHYVEGKIFPIPGKHGYPDFDSYYEQNKETLKCSKHKAMHTLVRSKINLAANAYKALMDSCHYARYKSYDVKLGEATAARERMAFVKSQCI